MTYRYEETSENLVLSLSVGVSFGAAVLTSGSDYNLGVGFRTGHERERAPSLPSSRPTKAPRRQAMRHGITSPLQHLRRSSTSSTTTSQAPLPPPAALLPPCWTASSSAPGVSARTTQPPGESTRVPPSSWRRSSRPKQTCHCSRGTCGPSFATGCRALGGDDPRNGFPRPSRWPLQSPGPDPCYRPRSAVPPRARRRNGLWTHRAGPGQLGGARLHALPHGPIPARWMPWISFRVSNTPVTPTPVSQRKA